ncbi:MAG: SPOR domain-containing protein [Proteobacteria bacterium]|nr:SPOR domain-containing protein [Pseudomonadota bacterium]
MKPLMDRSLKERIIGAVVLVVFAVMVVPVFLDGPSTKTEIITESVSLPGQNGQTRKIQTIVLERDRTEPEPVPVQVSGNTSGADNKPAVIHVKKDQPVADKSLGTGPVKSEPKTAGNTKLVQAISPTGMWAVQLGSFSNQANADHLAADLRRQGFAAFLSQLQTESGSLHRVRIGPQKNREGAEAMAAKLNSAGHKGRVVTHP